MWLGGEGGEGQFLPLARLVRKESGCLWGIIHGRITGRITGGAVSVSWENVENVENSQKKN
jgi:hypothetical protein